MRPEGEFGPKDFAAVIPVSRETLSRLQIYAELLRKWNLAINLVAKHSMPQLWRRHLLDSAQLFRYLPNPGARPLEILDLGSGAGFPGLVLALMGAGRVRLVESDGRKCQFLREVLRATDCDAEVVNARAETLAGETGIDVVTARALAPLPRLLGLAAPFLEKGAVGLFPKGAGVDDELTRSQQQWHISVERHPSISDPTGVILQVRMDPNGRARR